jgi:hypothetical protein
VIPVAQWTTDKAYKAISAAKRAKSSSDAVYQEAMELTFPDRENFYRTQEGQSKSAYNWDSSSTVSVIRTANRMLTDYTPNFMDWMEISLGPAADAIPDEAFKQMTGRTKDEEKARLEAASKIANAVLHSPTFPNAAHEMYVDWLYGQGGMKVVENTDIIGEPVIFSGTPFSHFYAKEGANGYLDQWFFWHEVRADAIKAEWGDAKLTPWLEEQANLEDPPMIKLASVCYRDYDEQDRPFRYEVYHFRGSNGVERARIVERQERTPAFVTPRYSKLAGENRGRGPVLFALPDIRTANKIVELTLRAAAVAVSGVYTAVDNAVTSAIRIKPLSVINVRRNGGPEGPSLQRLDTPQRIDFGEVLLDKLQMNIRKILGDNSLPPEADPIRTATEFVQRARELMTEQAGGLSRLHVEFVVPLVNRVIDILERKQVLPFDGLRVDQFIVQVKMKSPLAQTEQMQEVETLLRYVEMLRMMGGDALVAYEINIDRAPRHIADLLSVSMNDRNTEEEKAEIKEGIAAAAQAQAGVAPEGGQPQ